MNIPVVDKLLEIGNKLIPDKDAQLEYEKKIRELDIENMKVNKELFAKIIPITFPVCVWIGCLFCLWGLFLSVMAFVKEGRYIFFEVKIPSFLMMTCGVFVTGLFGKKNVAEFFKGKNGGDKE
ncbi:hypothetical protein [Fusobacterium necrophorum]|uniref:hypothetical protein n=1 Tax=Fusobacterium necrophorum TaxID=859 RepID=UPI0001BC47E1|nr:hypothetical protein [Fusobacterium necrophorum]EFS22900.1 hypothetical protein FSEG_00507 [Fusobacterium necrophorum D12]MDK4504659.1 hypothetical protein [Fusobacterium necrophorum]